MTFPIPPIWYWLLPRFIELRDDGVIEGNALGINFIRDPVAYILGNGYGVVDLINSPSMPGAQFATIQTSWGAMISGVQGSSDPFLSNWGFQMDSSNSTITASGDITLVGNKVQFTKGSYFYMTINLVTDLNEGECNLPLNEGVCGCAVASDYFYGQFSWKKYNSGSAVPADPRIDVTENYNLMPGASIICGLGYTTQTVFNGLVSIADYGNFEMAFAVNSSAILLPEISALLQATINLYNIPYFNSNL